MNVLITGADGFIGRGLSARICAGDVFRVPLHRLTLVGLDLDAGQSDSRVRSLVGSIADPEVVAAALADRPSLVFHLAAVTSAEAERNFELGLAVNLNATVALCEALRKQQEPPVVVFPSTIAVFGPPYPAVVDDSTWPTPALSYGAEKLMIEVLLADYSRRGWLDGRSLRLPGIVARPPMRTGAASAFSSDLIRVLASGGRFVCPVSAVATHWLMSRECGIDNLLHASQLDSSHLPPRRVVNLPCVHATTEAVVEALAQRLGPGIRERVEYVPDPHLEAVFGSFPPLVAAAAERLGFRSDGGLGVLLERGLEAAGIAHATPKTQLPTPK